MNHQLLTNLVVFLLGTTTINAQDTAKTQLSYDLTTEAAFGSGNYTASQLVSNRHHVLATRQNTAYLRGAVNLEHNFSEKLTLTSGVDVITSVHADHKAYLQQCYANLQAGPFFIEAGSREQAPVLRHAQLSTGSFVKGTNAKPIPQIHIGTNGFWTIPFTRQWLQANFDFGYGKFLDSNYREDQLRPDVNTLQKYATGIYYHQKHLYFRTNPEKRFFGIVGIEHAVQFGGSSYIYNHNELKSKSKPANLKAFWDVILPLGDSNYFVHDALEDWVFGNHVGMMTYQIGWNIDSTHQLQAYLDNPFEDGSGVRKGNGWDGLWGLQYQNKAAGRQLVRGAVMEYFQTTNQSGPLHWDSGDFPEPVRSQITDFVTGKDNYYNHTTYVSYTHYGMTPGNPLVTSPKYNGDNISTEFLDNRVKAWHAGVNGELTDRLSYLVKGAYQEGWGTYDLPLASKHHSFGALVQGTYAVGPWQCAAAYAFDHGNVYGNASTFNLKISFHGKIL